MVFLLHFKSLEFLGKGLKIMKTLLLSFFFVISSAHAWERVNSRYLYHIDGTSPLGAIFYPDSVGTSPSPTPHLSEMREALAQFENPGLAVARIEEIKNEMGISRGTLFVNANYDTDGKPHARFTCGISSANSGDIDDVTGYYMQKEYGTSKNSGFVTWHNFKLASRAERVREIATCLSKMDGMPPLGDSPRAPIREIYMDNKTKREANAWMRTQLRENEEATEDQLYRAFKCMLVKAAQSIPDATGDKIVFRSYDYEGSFTTTRNESVGQFGPMNFTRRVPHHYDAEVNASLFAVVGNRKAVEHLYDNDEIENYRGLWPSMTITEGNMLRNSDDSTPNRFRDIFIHTEVLDQMDTCKLRAGIQIHPDLNPNGQSPGSELENCR